jgi:hypothetical protein
MKGDSGQTTSIWMATSKEIPSNGALATDTPRRVTRRRSIALR